MIVELLLLVSTCVSPTDTVLTSDGVRPALERVVVVGASLSSGYGTEVNVEAGSGVSERVGVSFDQVLQATILETDSEVLGFHHLFFFGDPLRVGVEIADQARAADPSLLVGLDFLFWFGYCSTTSDGQPLESGDDRLDMLEQGLKLLEPFECPIVVGDFADLSAAVGVSLPPTALPERDSLNRLNARLRGWADERSNVTVIPLARFLQTTLDDRSLTIGEANWPAGESSKLMGADRLHPTTDGAIALALLVLDELVAGGVIEIEAVRGDLPIVRQHLEQAALARFTAEQAELAELAAEKTREAEAEAERR